MSFLILLASFAVKSTVIFIIAALGSLLLKRFGPSYRHLIWTVAFAGILTLPVLQAALPQHPIEIVPTRVQKPEPTIPLVFETNPLPTDSSPQTPPPLSESPPFQPKSSTLLILAWAVGAFVCLGQQFISLWFLNRSAARCPRDSDNFEEVAKKVGVTRPWRLVYGRIAGVPGPMMWGILRPTIAMPEESRIWPRDQFESVLIHELVHIKRMDSLTQALAALVCALNWFNPIAWLCLAALKRESEAATDQAVLDAGIKPSTYADALLHAALARCKQRSFLNPGVPLMKQSKIEARVRAVLNPKSRDLKVTRLGAFSTFAAALLVVAPCATLQATATKPQPVQLKATRHLVSTLPHPKSKASQAEAKKELARVQHYVRAAQLHLLKEQLRLERGHVRRLQKSMERTQESLREKEAALKDQMAQIQRVTAAEVKATEFQKAQVGEAQKRALEAELLTREEQKRETEAQYKAGLLNKTEMLKAKADLERARAELLVEESLDQKDKVVKRIILTPKPTAESIRRVIQLLKDEIAAEKANPGQERREISSDGIKIFRPTTGSWEMLLKTWQIRLDDLNAHH